MAQKEIPCYLFVGMLESGKTKFIQETTVSYTHLTLPTNSRV